MSSDVLVAVKLVPDQMKFFLLNIYTYVSDRNNTSEHEVRGHLPLYVI